MHKQGWDKLRDVQERAIPPLSTSTNDVIVAAATAAGKTEAAFLPILSQLAFASDATTTSAPVDPWAAHDPWKEAEPVPSSGVQVLYLSPLKALINDQHSRLDQMCESSETPVHRWHGDVGSSKKKKVLKDPSGVLLMTPESLEAMFVTRGSQCQRIFAGIRFIVIDEMHSFLSSARGAQLQSLMHRVELVVRRPVQRVGLSATLGDLSAGCRFIRPARPETVVVIESNENANAISLQLRGYTHSVPDRAKAEDNDIEDEDSKGDSRVAIAEHLFKTLGGDNNLIFANSKANVEMFADRLRRMSEGARVPNEFWPHHGNLSKEMREATEAQLKDSTQRASAVCTSTLEMGIDIGAIESVAQIGPPPSVASLRQRLGRSGRRGKPSVLRIYVGEDEINDKSSIVHQLRCRSVQTTAMVDLMLDKWLERPDDPGYNYSTLVQQVLSTIAQHGGAKADQLFGALCGPGPFHLVDKPRFASLLRCMAAEDLIMQASDGLLLHGGEGERQVNHYGFYAAFQSGNEWRLVSGSKTLGTVDISHPLYAGVLLIFGGRRWQVVTVDSSTRTVELAKSSGGSPPGFAGDDFPLVSDEVRSAMREVLKGSSMQAWQNAGAQELIAQGRETFGRLGLDDHLVVADESGVLLLPWMGDKAMFTASMMLKSAGIDSEVDNATLFVPGVTPNELASVISALVDAKPPEPEDLAHTILNQESDKWDWVLDEVLLAESAGAKKLDVAGACSLLSAVLPELVSDTVAGQTISMSSNELLEAEYSIVDLETTGLSPHDGDRVVEIAVVRVRGDGTSISEWTTLVNPGRGVGATHIHEITNDDVANAPAFEEIAGDFIDAIKGSVLVAHNLQFDRSMLDAEFADIGLALPQTPSLCTMLLSQNVQPGSARRYLGALSERAGIELVDSHHALDDAKATTELLLSQLQIATQEGIRALEDLGCDTSLQPQFPDLRASGKVHLRCR